jgi:DNA-binding FadR family transcriptional regulator
VKLPPGDARRAVFAPLDDGSVRSEAVVRRLASAISLGLVADGERLPSEADLAVSLNVSTMTLRDALADLRERGLVVTRRGHGGGSFVQSSPQALSDLARSRLLELGTADLRELGDVHAAISGSAAQLAAARATEQEVSRLRDLAERLSATAPAAEQRRLEGRFYVEVAAASQSVRLTMHEIDICSEAGQIPWPLEGCPDRVRCAAAAHRGVVDAVAMRNGPLARSLTEQHLGARTNWLIELRRDLLRGHDPAAPPPPGTGSPAGDPVRFPGR